MGLANLLRPEPFKCKKKGDSEQLLQDFKEQDGAVLHSGTDRGGTHTGPGREDTECAPHASRRKPWW